jgi:hypothetical protein
LTGLVVEHQKCQLLVYCQQHYRSVPHICMFCCLLRRKIFPWTSNVATDKRLITTYKGIDIKEMLVGAAQMDEETRNTEV